MKNYIQMLVIIVVIVGSDFCGNVIFAAQPNPIVSVSTGSNSLVDAIKGYSDITEDDVDKWKLLWLGGLNALPALAIGTYSTVKAAEVTGNVFKSIEARDPSDWLKKRMLTLPDSLKEAAPWTAIAAIGAGLVSYKIFYPRIRLGVINKVQNFIDVCGRLTIAQQQINQVPVEWSTERPIAICKALNNLENQAAFAGVLLNQVGRNDPDVITMLPLVTRYHNNLLTNKNNQYFRNMCRGLIQIEEDERRRALRDRGENAAVAGMEIRNAKDIWKFTKDVVKTGRDVINWSIENNLLPLGMLGYLAYWWMPIQAQPNPSLPKQ